MTPQGPGAGSTGASAAELGARAFLAFGLYWLAMLAAGMYFDPGDLGTAAGFERASYTLATVNITLAVLAVFVSAGPWWKPPCLRRTVLLYLTFLVPWFLVAGVLYPTVLEALGSPLEPQDSLSYFTVEPTSTGAFAVALLATCVVVPLGEELLFRGYIQGAIRAVAPAWVAVAVTAALFGAVHGLDYAFPIGLLGAFFGVLRERYGCVLAPVLAHATHNSLTVAITVASPELFEWMYG